MISLFTAPTPADVVSSSSAWTVSFSPETWMILSIIVGCFAFGAFTPFLARQIIAALRKILGGRRRRGGFRRR